MRIAADDQARNVVTTDNKGVVVCILRGKQTDRSVRELADEFAQQTEPMRAEGKRILVLTDIRELSIADTSTGSRLESRKLLSLAGDASAVVGNPGILSMAMYLVRVIKPGSNIRFFTSEHKARAWLESTRHARRPRTSVSLVAGLAVGVIGLLGLVGWKLNNPYLLRGLPSLKPMNPVGAIGLMAIGYGFVCYWFGKLRQLKLAGLLGVAIGLAALVSIVQTLVLHHKLVATNDFTQSAASAGFCFIAIGLSPFTVGTKKWWVRMLQYVLGTVLVGLSLFNIFGQLYAHDFIYGLNGTFVMAFNLAVAFLITGLALVLLVLYREIGNILGGVTRIGWLIVASLILVQVATYGAWSQAVSRNMGDSSSAFLRRGDDLDAALDQRVQAYTDALYGFKGLFVASDYIDQGEFQAYYNSLDLPATYPGLRALSFISIVNDKDLPAFVATHRADKSLNPGGNPKFTITSKSSGPLHYIVTYSATSSSPGGTDLGSTPSRLAIFQKAKTQSGPISSGTLQFAGGNGQPAQSGFFITMPVASKASSKLPNQPAIGFVNAVFTYNDFFAHAFKPVEMLDGLTISVADTQDHIPVYVSLKGGDAKKAALTRVIPVSILDHTWDMSLAAPANFGISRSQAVLPKTILAGGQLFSLLLVIIFVLQARARRQGFVLADSLTQDLAIERNRAVANDQRSTAILSSIGDAVFAIDLHQRITIFNPSAEHISGVPAAQAIGKRYDEILHFELEKTGRVNSRFIHEALAGHLTSMSNHTVLVRRDGKRVPVADSAAPIHDAAHKIQGAIIVFRDVTKDYELDKAKTEFVSLASHQLRTPLSAINWYGEMLLSGDAGKLNKTQREYMTEISNGNKRMVDLVNSLLNVSRLEVGKLINKPEPNDVRAVIASLEKELRADIKTKGLAFTTDLHQIPKVVADSKQLRMVLQNLMSNAIKYTPDKGSVTVTLRPATETDLKHAKLTSAAEHWYLMVKDTGYGIPKAEQSKIFAKLYRADNVRRMNVEGTGLGLYIVKEIIEKMGGRVWFDSVEGKGTTFYVVAPVRSGKHNE